MCQFLKIVILYLYHLFIIFGFLFEIPIYGPLTTRRLSVLIGMIILLINKKNAAKVYSYFSKKKIGTYYALFLFCALLSLFNVSFQTSMKNTYLEIWYFFYMILYILVFAVFLVVEFKDIEKLVYVYIGAFALQFVIVLYGLLDNNFLIYIYENWYFGDDRFAETVSKGTRLMGIALNSSNGSITCSSACVLIAFAYITGRLNRFLFYLSYSMMMILTIFIGRTGALVELALLVYIIMINFKLSNIFIIIGFIFCGVSIITYLLGEVSPLAADALSGWIMGAFDPESRSETINGIAAVVPSLSPEMIFGTGVMRGRADSGIVVGSDSGYVKFYGAIGIIGAFCYYLAYLKLFSLPMRKFVLRKLKFFFYFVIVLIYIIEYKEPFLMYYTLPCAFLTVLLFNEFYARKNINIE
ncbi:hypothetical protein DWW10_21265 [Bacteroides intestinalis]|uniref:O-antigen ligase domain-containing protein n=2 Tax=Bacteroides intestinalis TaxID=329854 RepID=A0A412XVG9_9BACE|nr:hypothetical protein DWW10_21265 [Bacteroides intestinalis]RHA54749.1 hypothetical protein DW932_22010 [Bacteroides intestinalis]